MKLQKDKKFPLIFSDNGKLVERGTKEWGILAVDDNEDILKMNQLALEPLKQSNIHLSYHTATTAEKAKEALSAHSDIAVILLDIMMETSTAGLDLVNYIRNELENEEVQIIIVTGEPARYPDEQVVLEYDIKDYLVKGSFDARELRCSVIAALKSFQHLRELKNNIRKIKQLSRSSRLFIKGNLHQLVESVYHYLTKDLDMEIGVYHNNERVNFCEVDNIEAMDRMYQEWNEARQMPNFISGYYFQEIHEFPGYIFVARCGEKESAFVDIIVSQAEMVRENIFSFVRNKPLLSALVYIMDRLQSVVYIEADKDYCNIVCEDDVIERFRVKISDIQVLFSSTRLLQVHKSYLVNPKFIRGTQKKGRSFSLVTRLKNIPVGQKFKENVNFSE